jgi:hypothetical protein
MRFRVAIFAVAMLPGLAAAQQPVSAASATSADADARAEQVQAATDDAVVNLRQQILRTRLTRDITVGDFLDKTRSQPELTRVMKGAQPLGGPRWVDDHTCQVQLELPESAVAAMLMGIAHNPALNPPVSPETLKAKFSDWKRLNFSVIGSSAGGESIEAAKPLPAAGKWSEVDEASRKNTIARARADAIHQAMTAIGPIHLSATVHASDALARPAIADRLGKWLDRQPVTRIEFLDDLKVSVTIAINPKSLERILKFGVENDAEFSRDVKIDAQQFDREIQALPTTYEGSAAVAVAPVASSLPVTVLPIQSPDWVDQQLTADGNASGGGPRLKVARAAEADAVEKIRRQFLQLHINSNSTLEDAVRSDPQLKQAVDRAILHAHTYRVDYHADGSVKVQMSLDLRDAWDALRSNP